MDSSGKTRPIRVETLSPMAPPRRASGGVLGLFGCLSHRQRGLQAPIDWGQSIYHNDAQATID
jgi:hypothetical protein